MKRRNLREHMELLWERCGGRCAYCEKPLEKDEIVVEHRFPIALGGSDDPENLILACSQCNKQRANRTIHEREFQYYIKQMLERDSRFYQVESDVRWSTPEGNNQLFDLTFCQHTDGSEQTFVVEVKMLQTATAEKIESIVRQMQDYRRSLSDARFVLALPIPLAKEYRQKIWREDILLWDRETLRAGIPDIPAPAYEALDQFDELRNRLKQCRAGWSDWRVYQKLIGDILDLLFCPPLDTPSEQNADGNRANRRDFILPNYAENGYWRYLRERYRAEFVLVDAKNSGASVTKEDILQVSHYLKEKGLGMFGLIFSRAGTNQAAREHLRDIWQNEEKMLLILDDGDVEQMLLSKQSGGDPCRLLIEKIQEFRQEI